MVLGFTIWCVQFCILCAGKMRSIFCGNLDYDVRQSDLERMFKRYGRVDRVEMKSGEHFFELYVHFKMNVLLVYDDF